MRALLDDPPRLQHDDAVGRGGLRQAVCDDERGAAAQRRVGGGLEHARAAGAGLGGRLVENDDRVVGEHEPRQRDLLRALRRQRVAAVADDRPLPFG